MADFGTLICDDYGEICDCCERAVRRTRGSLWHGRHRICPACFYLWYDGAGVTDTGVSGALLKEAVLKAEREGTYPFDKPDGDLERVPY